jgi:hypothetical protein
MELVVAARRLKPAQAKLLFDANNMRAQFVNLFGVPESRNLRLDRHLGLGYSVAKIGNVLSESFVTKR